jgi:hypothetical protein
MVSDIAISPSRSQRPEKRSGQAEAGLAERRSFLRGGFMGEVLRMLTLVPGNGFGDVRNGEAAVLLGVEDFAGGEGSRDFG